MHTISARSKQAELASGVGAGVLGLGLGVLLSGYLQSSALPLLGVGALLHGWGMWDKRRLERGSGALTPWWATVLYWVCWIALAGLASYVVLRR